MELKDINEKVETGLAGIAEQVLKNNLELKGAFEERLKQVEAKGFADPELKEKVDRLFTRADELEARLGAPDSSGRTKTQQQKSVADQFADSDQFKEWAGTDYRGRFKRLIIDRSPFGPSMLKAQTRNSDLGSPTAGVVAMDRLNIFDPLPMIKLTVRDLLGVQPVTTLSVDWLRQLARTNAASPQVEGTAKVESTYTWESVSTAMKTIAHYFQVTTQVLADNPWFRSEVDSELMYGLKLKEETELLLGDGLGSHVSGLIPNATAYSTALNVANDTALDTIRHAIYQARLALYPVDGIVLHPKNLHNIELLKTEDGGTANKGAYLQSMSGAGMTIKTIWGLPVVECDNMAINSFLVGAFNKGAILFDRQQAVIDVSYETGSNFVENEATVRCEERVGLGIRRAGAFIYGTGL